MSASDIDKLSVEELWSLYGATHDRLKKLGEIRSRNITGVSTSPFNEHLVSFLEPGGVSRWAHS